MPFVPSSFLLLVVRPGSPRREIVDGVEETLWVSDPLKMEVMQQPVDGWMALELSVGFRSFGNL